ncbi:MAG: glycosyltransferase family 2 protein [Deltaproteobacteria bacterium]|nr:glycosyltransferase family 2 protein [Deltaproteobacteria bacterium]
MNPLVSVVIPCWNAEATIGEAVESALGQTYPEVEVVVVDDGSTDDSLAVISRYGTRVVVDSGPNRGACAARNRGTSIAKGRWIQFLDADDLLVREKLELQVRHAESVTNPRTLSISLGRPDQPDAFLSWQYSRPYPSGMDPILFLLNGILLTPAPLHLKESLVRVGGFDETLPCSQEYDLHLRLACDGMGLSQLRESLFISRRQTNGISANGTRVMAQRRKILGGVRGLLEASNALTAERRTAIAVTLARSATHLELHGNREEAGLHWSDALALDADAAALSWTRPWRPIVRAIGSTNTARVRNGARGLVEKLKPVLRRS